MKKNKFWTKERCIQDAKKYKTKKEWQRKSSGFYAAFKNGWYVECTQHMVNGKIFWTKERCIQDAKKYKTKTKWQNSSRGAYKAAIKHGWLNECYKDMPNGYKLRWAKQKKI